METFEIDYEMEVDNEAVRARVAQVIELYADGVQRTFAQMTNIDETVLSKLLKAGNKRTFMEVHLRAIEQATRVRLEWLLYGEEPMRWPVGEIPQRPPLRHEGQMLRAYLDKNGPSDTELGIRLGKAKSTVSKYFDTVTFSVDNRISILHALGVAYEDVFGPHINYFKLSYGPEPSQENERLLRHIGNFSAEPIIELPWVPRRARAGIPTPQFWEHPLETYRIMRATLFQYEPDPSRPRKDWWIIEVDGDSMEPQLRSRAKVLGYYVGQKVQGATWEIDLEQVSHLKPGIWAIQYDDDFVIKRINENTLKRDKQLIAHSDNPPPGPFVIRASSIRHVWFIETVVDMPVR